MDTNRRSNRRYCSGFTCILCFIFYSFSLICLVALLLASHRGGVSKEYFIHQLGYTFLNEIPFDSDRKCMSVIYKTPQNSHMILSKGAPETILKICNRILTENSVKEFSKEFYQNIEKQYENMAARGLRVLALAYDNSKPFSKENSLDLFVENDLIFIGLIGLIDPPRVQVKPAIKKCRDAGIRVCMITGVRTLSLEYPLLSISIRNFIGTGFLPQMLTSKSYTYEFLSPGPSQNCSRHCTSIEHYRSQK